MDNNREVSTQVTQTIHPEIQVKTGQQDKNSKKHVAKHGQTSKTRQDRFNKKIGNAKQDAYKKALEAQFMCKDIDIQHQTLHLADHVDSRPTLIPVTRSYMQLLVN